MAKKDVAEKTLFFEGTLEDLRISKIHLYLILFFVN